MMLVPMRTAAVEVNVPPGPVLTKTTTPSLRRGIKVTNAEYRESAPSFEIMVIEEADVAVPLADVGCGCAVEVNDWRICVRMARSASELA